MEINKEDLVRKTKSELVALAETFNIGDEVLSMSKSQIIDLILSASESNKEVIYEDDAKNTAFNLELAKRSSKFKTGIYKVSEASGDTAFNLELAKRSSKFKTGIRTADVDTAFRQELSKREIKHS